MKRDRCSSCSKSSGDGGNNQHCPDVYGLSVLITNAEDYNRDPLSILCQGNYYRSARQGEGQSSPLAPKNAGSALGVA